MEKCVSVFIGWAAGGDPVNRPYNKKVQSTHTLLWKSFLFAGEDEQLKKQMKRRE